MLSITEQEERKTGKELYSYQKGAIQKIFQCFETAQDDYHLLYQLPTGGGKTVIFSEIVSQYLSTHKKKKSIGYDSQDRVVQTNIFSANRIWCSE